MRIGHHVIHKETQRTGRVQSFGNTLPTTINVKWDRNDTITNHNPDELDLSLCNKEHTMYKGLFCTLKTNHEGWCGCN